MIELIHGERIIKNIASVAEAMEILKPAFGHTKFMDDSNGREGIFDRLEQDEPLSVGSNSMGPHRVSYFWYSKEGRYITETDGQLWFRFDEKPRWRIQLISNKMEKSCLLCTSQCKSEKPCNLYDEWKLVI